MRTVYGKDSKILYRQHGNNSVGLKKTWPIKYWVHCALRKNSNESDMLLELNELYEDSVIPRLIVLEIKEFCHQGENPRNGFLFVWMKTLQLYMEKQIGFKLKNIILKIWREEEHYGLRLVGLVHRHHEY
ncbi:MAG: hypothetical protein ACLRT5_10475 [Lachnospiraceae bacterium]